MPKRVAAFVAALAALAAVATFTRARGAGETFGHSRVVVELFTSQGCSSCPPAEALLHSLVTDAATRSVVIPLAFHVDYWDGLGWRDPFSSPVWTARQREYVRAMHLDGAYTPQAVVAGTRQLVGSSGAALRAAIAEASRRPAEASVRIEAIGADAARIVTKTARAGLQLLVLTSTDSVVTHVSGGENGGRTLAGDAIAMTLVRMDVPEGTAGHRVAFPAGRARHLVALVQDPRSMKIYAAATAAIPR